MSKWNTINIYTTFIKFHWKKKPFTRKIQFFFFINIWNHQSKVLKINFLSAVIHSNFVEHFIELIHWIYIYTKQIDKCSNEILETHFHTRSLSFALFLSFITALSRQFLIIVSRFFRTPVRQKLDLLQTRYKPEKMLEIPLWRDKLEPLVRLKKREREREWNEKMEKYHNCTSRENIIYLVASISTVNLVSGMLLRFKSRHPFLHCGFKVFPRHLFLLFYLYLLRREEEKKNMVIATC